MTTNATPPGAPPRDEARAAARERRRPRDHAARGRSGHRQCVDRDHGRVRPLDDRRRSRELSVLRVGALVGDPDDHDRGLRRQCPDDVRRTVHRRGGDDVWDRLPDGHHGSDHEHVRCAFTPRAGALGSRGAHGGAPPSARRPTRPCRGAIHRRPITEGERNSARTLFPHPDRTRFDDSPLTWGIPHNQAPTTTTEVEGVGPRRPAPARSS